MQISLTGQRAFVTAGGDGIGRSTVLALHDAGAQVTTCDIDSRGLGTLPDGVETHICDVSDSAALNTVFDHLLPQGLDILVNNAGVSGPTKLVEDVTDAEWRQTMAVGIDSQFYCARRAAPVFKSQRSGVMINMTSTAGTFGYPTRAPYAAAKWAVTGFTKTLAMELGPHNVRVNAIAPGSVNGDRMDRVVQGHATVEGITPDDVRALYSKGVSMNCFVDPDEIASLIVFLCSDFGRHISGQIIALDGNTERCGPARKPPERNHRCLAPMIPPRC